jgi:hypothetical protein
MDVDSRRIRESEDALILRSLDARYLDDDGDGYGGVPFVSLGEAIHAMTDGRNRHLDRALRRAGTGEVFCRTCLDEPEAQPNA